MTRDDVSLSFNTLGPLEVSDDGQVLSLGSPLQRGLLAALLIEKGHPVSVPALMDRLWADDPPDTAVKSIQKYVSNLRRILGSNRILSNGGYKLVVGPDEVDASRFEHLLTRPASKVTDPVMRLAQLDEALALWRGEPYADLSHHLFLEPVRVRFEELRLTAIEERLSILLLLGRLDHVSAETVELVEVHPYRESLWQIRMTALAKLGRQADALGEFRRLRSVLGEQLGLDPSPETTLLEEKILLRDPELSPDRVEHGNLPSLHASIMGRDRELLELETQVGPNRLVTIVGTAGVGKTLLALAVGRRVASRYPQGVWFVGLGPVTDPHRVLGRTAEILGVPESPIRAGADPLIEHMTQRRALVIFDNCEHVLDSAADVVRRLVVGAGVDVVATSRQALGLNGETVYQLDALAYPTAEDDIADASAYPAVQLMMTRAEQAGARLPANDASLVDLADITRCLDGIPLAIELAAAQLRVVSPSELCDRLRRQISPLGTDRRDLPDRQQTLDAAFDWSYQLLGPDEQRLLARLSVFRGGFTLESAHEVCGSPEVDTLEALTSLIDASLVTVNPQADGPNRYFLLRVIRLFAQERLGEESEDLAGHHAAFFVRHAADQPTRRTRVEPGRLIDLARDYENVRAAMTHLLDSGDVVSGLALAVSLDDYWNQVGTLREAQSWLERFIAAAPDAPHDLRARAYLVLSDAYHPFSSDLSLRAAESALFEASEAGQVRLFAEAQCSVGRVHASRVERQPAVALIKEALARFENLDDEWGMAACHEALGVAFRGTEDDVDHYLRAVELYRRLGSDQKLAAALFSMSYRSLIPRGRFAEARTALTESEQISRRFGMYHGILHARTGLGQLARLEGRREEAQVVLSDALQGAKDIGDRRCTVRMLAALAHLSHEIDYDAQAWEYLGEALEVATALDPGLSSDLHELVDGMALVALAEGDSEMAARWFGAAEGLRLHQGLLRPPSDQAIVTGARQQLEGELGAARARALDQEGLGTTLEELAEQWRHHDYARSRTPV